jgi:hypothetical protein
VALAVACDCSGCAPGCGDAAVGVLAVAAGAPFESALAACTKVFAVALLGAPVAGEAGGGWRGVSGAEALGSTRGASVPPPAATGDGLLREEAPVRARVMLAARCDGCTATAPPAKDGTPLPGSDASARVAKTIATAARNNASKTAPATLTVGALARARRFVSPRRMSILLGNVPKSGCRDSRFNRKLHDCSDISG